MGHKKINKHWVAIEACCLFLLKRHRGDAHEGRTANLEGNSKEAPYFWCYPTSSQSSTSAITFPMRLMTSVKYAMALEGLCSVTGLWNRLLLQANTKPLLRWNSIYSWNVVPVRTEDQAGWARQPIQSHIPWLETDSGCVQFLYKSGLQLTGFFSTPFQLSPCITLVIWSFQISLFSSRGVLSGRENIN